METESKMASSSTASKLGGNLEVENDPSKQGNSNMKDMNSKSGTSRCRNHRRDSSLFDGEWSGVDQIHQVIFSVILDCEFCHYTEG